VDRQPILFRDPKARRDRVVMKGAVADALHAEGFAA
jgi:hypothetical protein